jgi:hypothetical protein
VETLVDFSMSMAKETEDLELNKDTITQGTINCVKNPKLGMFLVAFTEDDIPVGQTMVTFEMSAALGGMIYWIQSVYVKPDYRN